MRSHFIDSLRGMAVIWMIIFHTAYDLQVFHFVNLNFNEGFWFAFPRVIAFTFLYCVGASLNYVHHPRINWKSLKKRSLKLAGASIVISISTYLLFPSQWIFFGTLHCILIGSILGALVVNRRDLAWIILVSILTLQYGLGFDIKWVSSIVQKPSMDFIPIYPWFWAVLLGILTAPHLSRLRWISDIKSRPHLNFLGQHSLSIYLVHQPVIFGILWAYSYLS